MTKGALEDKFAYNEFKLLVEKFNIKKIIETGTYHGWSTIKLSEFEKEVVSIEISPENYAKAVENIKKNNLSNVEILLGSSPEILENLVSFDEKNLLIFLDAHWHNYWPIHDELRVLITKKVKPVLVIHDFFVPNENGSPKFGFDRYNGQNLDFDYIKTYIFEMYGDNGFEYHYNKSIDCVDSGLIFIYPK